MQRSELIYNENAGRNVILTRMGEKIGRASCRERV